MDYPTALSARAAQMKSRGKKPELDHLRVYEAENSGHIVEHHFAHQDGE